MTYETETITFHVIRVKEREGEGGLLPNITNLCFIWVLVKGYHGALSCGACYAKWWSDQGNTFAIAAHPNFVTIFNFRNVARLLDLPIIDSLRIGR